MNKRQVYLDHAATTSVHSQVMESMLPYFCQKFGNPSSVHCWGQEARIAVDEAREKIAKILGCQAQEIVFTPSATTADNLAIAGLARANKGQIIASAIEHHAILDTVKALEKQGREVAFLAVDKYGVVDLEALKKALAKPTALVSIMYANNEIGTIEPIGEIAKIIKKKEKEQGSRIYFHTDAATAVGWLDINVHALGVDLMSLGAHKFGGPKGIGLLYVRQGAVIEPITFGGHHENGLWPGTEPVPLIVGASKALEIATSNIKHQTSNIKRLQARLTRGILKIPGVELIGPPKHRLADIASFVVSGVEGEAMLLLLSDNGIAASSGSACTSGDLKPSHVLLAMGIPAQKAHGSIRFSLGPETTKEDIDYVLKVFPGVVDKLRKLRGGIK